MRFRLARQLSAAGLALTVALCACSNEGEGEPCSTDNGYNDCDDNLICEAPPNPHATNAPSVCCPQDPSQATTPECTLNGNVDSGNPAPPDSSVDGGHDATVEGATEAAADSGSGGNDAASDGSNDASVDGPAEAASSTDGGPG